MTAPRLPLVAALLLAAAPAAGQAPRAFDLQTYEPPPAGDRFFSVPDATTPGHLSPAAALVLPWAADPMVLRVNGLEVDGGKMVHRQFWAFAQGSLGLGERWLLDLTMPVALYQSGSHPFPGLAPVASSGLGDLRLGGRRSLGAWRGVALAAGGDLWLPTGSTTAFASDGAPRVQLKGLASGEVGRMAWSTEGGLLWRKGEDLVVTRIGSALTYAVAIAWRQGAWRVGPELYGRLQFEGRVTSPVEVLLGGHWTRGGIDAGLAAGTGLDRAPGAAPVRILAQVAWRPERLAQGVAPAPVDRAAEAALLDAERRAAERAEAEKAAAQRLAARRAADEKAAADRAEAERLARLAAEKVAAEKAAAERPPPEELVKLTSEKIEILQAVNFETDRDVILPESERILEQVAAVLAGHRELTRVRVEGHTDSKGGRDHNMKLSAARARSVRKWLVGKGGIDSARLEAQGYGPDRPVATNATAEGRARNRRVELKILEQGPAR